MDAVMIHVAPTSPSSITTYREPIVCLDDDALDKKPRPVTPVEPTPKVDEVRDSLEFRRSRTRAATLDEAWWLKLNAASARYHSERRAARRALTPSALGRGRDN